jgi:large subunit ribosomal protein L6
MSRIAKKPIQIPAGIVCDVQEHAVIASKGGQKFVFDLHSSVRVTQVENTLTVASVISGGSAMLGTTCVLVANFLQGLHKPFEKKLLLVGVGYRAKSQGNTIELSLGYSHPVSYIVPVGITVSTPSPTEIIISGADKQSVGQVAANIRALRPPEPYKGKGVRYANEVVHQKETKKKK